MPYLVTALLVLFATVPARACGLALVLATDISGSVDPSEFRLQIDGLAGALRDPVVSEALVREEAVVAVLQWTGTNRQAVSIPWTEIKTFDDVEALATRTEAITRKWRNFSTAIGEALQVSLDLFDSAPNCARRVIDISGDGSSNEGPAPRTLWPALEAAGVTVNALVILGSEPNLMEYFRTEVITGQGAFALSAQDHAAYPKRIRDKLRRETARALSELPPPQRPQIMQARRLALENVITHDPRVITKP